MDQSACCKTHRDTKGYVHVYTGNGKGKTTAALGLALRAAGAGFRIYIAQFMKNGLYSEIKSLQRFADQIVIEQFGSGDFITGAPSCFDRQRAGNAVKKIQSVYADGGFQMVILEEANMAVVCGLIRVWDLVGLIEQKPESLELVITGRYAARKVIARADLVTEMKAVKHYYKRGIRARIGIEK